MNEEEFQSFDFLINEEDEVMTAKYEYCEFNLPLIEGAFITA